jgi:RecA-family ATPase
MVLGGGSKSAKTWSLMHLGLALSTGQPWWGYKIPPKPRRVLYINLEIQREFFIKRINTIKEAMGIAGHPTLFSSMSLRGNCDDHTRLLPRLSEFLSDRKSNDWEAIILDPLYKMLHGSESDQEYIAALVDSIERFGDRHNAATIYGAHYAKGDAFAKSPMDRIAGSGVIGRDADTLIMVTRMPDDPDVFVQDTIVRNFAPEPQRNLRYIHPPHEARTRPLVPTSRKWRGICEVGCSPGGEIERPVARRGRQRPPRAGGGSPGLAPAFLRPGPQGAASDPRGL